MTNTFDLLAVWFAADKSFVVDAPNAALTCVDSSGEVVRAVVKLLSALSSYNDDVQFEAHLGNAMPDDDVPGFKVDGLHTNSQVFEN